ncbi:alpha/beta hydrolase [Leptospira biflexa]|uniref:alpha/beta hydrolase n=1 Tax=Leptospira biflexa TaxID=172 RepID=UPI001F36CEE5|nr:alpha/beta hydrolase [Leptospira biflexa]
MKIHQFIQKFSIIGVLMCLGMGCLPWETWDKTFPRSEKVEHKKVQFMNRYGIKLKGDLYLPKNRGSEPLAALAISGPFGAVKEQSSGLYAQTMAEKGFVTLAFDPSFTGESGGEPRNTASPDINTEDFSAAVDYLGLLSEVDRDRIGIIGICGFGGMGLNAAAVDKRIRAVVTTSMYDMSRVLAKGLNDSLTKEGRSALLEALSEQRSVDAKNGKPAPGPRILPETLEGNTSPITEEFFQYYRTERGFHKNSPNSNGSWTATTLFSFMNMPLLTYVKEISPRPVLLIAGDSAHSRYFSEDVFKEANEPKELIIVPNANHVDLYDKMDKIPFDTIDSFFKENLKVSIKEK